VSEANASDGVAAGEYIAGLGRGEVGNVAKRWRAMCGSTLVRDKPTEL